MERAQIPVRGTEPVSSTARQQRTGDILRIQSSLPVPGINLQFHAKENEWSLISPRLSMLTYVSEYYKHYYILSTYRV